MESIISKSLYQDHSHTVINLDVSAHYVLIRIYLCYQMKIKH